MFIRINKIKNVGLFSNATAQENIALEKVTLFYADNGRGKSTLARIFRSFSLNDPKLIHEKHTIDTSLPPEVELLKTDNAVQRAITFKNGSWSESEPIEIFDSEFIDQNVYSGFEVRPEQRASLLEFALGDQTVKLKHQIDKTTKEIENQTRARSTAERLIKAYSGPYSVSEFIAIPKIADLSARLEKTKKRIEATKRVSELMKRHSPEEIPLLNFDVIALFGLLGKQIEDIEIESELVVKKHLDEHSSSGLENWISSNPDVIKNDICPYCGRSVVGLELIKYYRSYFNKSYQKLKSEVVETEKSLTSFFSDSNIEKLEAIRSTNQARIEGWADQIALNSPELDYEQTKKTFNEIRTRLLYLVAKKRMSPLEPLGSDSEATIVLSLLTKINDSLQEYNKRVKSLATKISEFKKELNLENIDALQKYLKKLEVAESRQRPEVISTITDYKNADKERKGLEGEKIKARKQIQDLMSETLLKYQESINGLLEKFGAEFTIEELKPSYLGDGTARTEYGLKIRGKNVKLGTKTNSQGIHSFSTTLSEADKRTLAFAFFIAKLENEKSLNLKTIILDDPVSSLDQHRRTQTTELALKLISNAKQVIILSHDCYFLRAIEEVLLKQKPPASLKVYDLKRGEKEYSIMKECNLNLLCSSNYYHHYDLLERYSKSTVGISNREVAKAIRPLIEGYYHRKFPTHIPKKKMFGEIIQIIKNSNPNEPLATLIPMCDELTAINTYAGKFHHETNPHYETAPVIDSELTSYVKRALKLIWTS